MDPRRPPEYYLELSADRSYVKDVVKGILHTIFFHRYFTPLYPATHDVLDITLPYVTEDDVESLVEQRANAVLRQLEGGSNSLGGATPQSYSSFNGGAPKTGGRAQVVVQFLERKRKKGWFVAKADEETPWENWIIDVTLTSARSEPEAARNRRQMERSLQKAALNVITLANQDRSHIPPITTNDAPFPYQILVSSPKGDAWSQKTGAY